MKVKLKKPLIVKLDCSPFKAAKRGQLPRSPAWVELPQKLLDVMPCGCTIYISRAIQCAEHEAAHDPSVCIEALQYNRAEIEAHEARLGFTPIIGRPRNWAAMVWQHAGRYTNEATFTPA